MIKIILFAGIGFLTGKLILILTDKWEILFVGEKQKNEIRALKQFAEKNKITSLMIEKIINNQKILDDYQIILPIGFVIIYRIQECEKCGKFLKWLVILRPKDYEIPSRKAVSKIMIAFGLDIRENANKKFYITKMDDGKKYLNIVVH